MKIRPLSRMKFFSSRRVAIDRTVWMKTGRPRVSTGPADVACSSSEVMGDRTLPVWGWTSGST